MFYCSFCHAPATLRAGKLCLCGKCRRRLLALDPAERTYDWFVRAVREALFGGQACGGEAFAHLLTCRPLFLHKHEA